MSESKLPFISIILPAKNEERYIAQALDALSCQSYPKELMEIIVVDNNSTDRTAEISNQYDVKTITYGHGPVGAVRNFGFKKSIGEIIFFRDSDCVAPKDWITNAVNKLKSNSKLVLGGGYSLRKNPHYIERYWLLKTKNGASLPKDLLGGSIAIHRDAFQSTGMFSENITSGEDTLLSQTLIKNGYEVLITHKMSVIHLGNPITIKDFFYRQIWHSENYFKNLPASLRDPVFYLCIMAIICFVLMAISALLLNSAQLTVLFLVFLLLLPIILSVKRIVRSESYLHFIRIPAIYVLDAIYLAGRSSGLLISLKNRLLHR